MTDWTYLGVVVVAAATLIWCMYIQKDRIKMMIEVDKGHEKKEEKEGAKKEEKGRSRNRWDYILRPNVTKDGNESRSQAHPVHRYPDRAYRNLARHAGSSFPGLGQDQFWCPSGDANCGE